MLEEFLGRDVTAPIYGKGWDDLEIAVVPGAAGGGDKGLVGKVVDGLKGLFGG